MVLDQIALTVTGFEGLVQSPQYAYLAGAGVAFGFALIGGIAGAWRDARGVGDAAGSLSTLPYVGEKN